MPLKAITFAVYLRFPTMIPRWTENVTGGAKKAFENRPLAPVVERSVTFSSSGVNHGAEGSPAGGDDFHDSAVPHDCCGDPAGRLRGKSASRRFRAPTRATRVAVLAGGSGRRDERHPGPVEAGRRGGRGSGRLLRQWSPRHARGWRIVDGRSLWRRWPGSRWKR